MKKVWYLKKQKHTTKLTNTHFSWTDLQIVVMAAEVGGGLVFFEKGIKVVQQTLCGPMFRHRPHRIVACYQQKVCLGPSESLLQPGQLPVCSHQTHRSSRLLVCVVEGVAAQHYSVEHDYGQSLASVGNVEVQLVIIGREFPEVTKRYKVQLNVQLTVWDVRTLILSCSLPSVRSLAVVDLGFNVPCMVMIACNHVPGDLEGLCSKYSLKGILTWRFKGDT